MLQRVYDDDGNELGWEVTDEQLQEWREADDYRNEDAHLEAEYEDHWQFEDFGWGNDELYGE